MALSVRRNEKLFYEITYADERIDLEQRVRSTYTTWRREFVMTDIS